VEEPFLLNRDLENELLIELGVGRVIKDLRLKEGAASLHCYKTIYYATVIRGHYMLASEYLDA